MAQVRLDAQSQLCWDRELLDSVITRAIDFTKQKRLESPTLFVEYAQCSNPRSLSDLYRLGEVSVVVFGQPQDIDDLRVSNEAFFWFARVLT